MQLGYAAGRGAPSVSEGARIKKPREMPWVFDVADALPVVSERNIVIKAVKVRSRLRRGLLRRRAQIGRAHV